MLADCTQGGAAAVNQVSTIGTLEVGKKADLIVIDTMKPYLQPAGRILSAIIHGGQSSDIESVMVDGQFVMRANKVLTMDEPALVAEAAKVSQRVWDAVRKAGPIPRDRRQPGRLQLLRDGRRRKSRQPDAQYFEHRWRHAQLHDQRQRHVAYRESDLGNRCASYTIDVNRGATVGGSVIAGRDGDSLGQYRCTPYVSAAFKYSF